ncbi:MAG: hypothetical protein JW873_01320 [Candidatus Saganbacteria bacterium]|nr:hypothetical protein [Candidatus Saganbacteria bacterium]
MITINLKKIFFSLFLLLLLCGVSLAATPVITSVSPTAEPQTWVGTIEINGSNFEDGAVLTDGAGLTDATTGLHAIPTTFISSSKLRAYIRIASGATLGLSLPKSQRAAAQRVRVLGNHDLTVTNPDGSSSTEADCFTVLAAPSEPVVSSVYFDGTPYTAGMLISRQPKVSGHLHSSQGFSQAGSGVDFKILVDNVVRYDNLTAYVTIDPANSQEADFRYTMLPFTGFQDSSVISFNVKDVSGQSNELDCDVIVQAPVPSPEVTLVAPPLPDPSSSTNHDPTPANPISMQFQVTDTTPVTVRVMGHTPIAVVSGVVTPGYNTLIWDGTVGGGTVVTALGAAGSSPLTIVPSNRPSVVAQAKAAIKAAGAGGRELAGNGIALLFILGPDGRPLGRPGKTVVLR